MDLTEDQVMGQLRQLLQAIGTLAISTGWMTAEKFGVWSAVIIQGAGLISMLAGFYWAWRANGKSSILASVAKMARDRSSPVAGVITTNTKEGRELAASIPGPVVAAGTEAAKQVAAA